MCFQTVSCTGTSQCLIRSSNCQGGYCLKNHAICYGKDKSYSHFKLPSLDIYFENLCLKRF